MAIIAGDQTLASDEPMLDGSGPPAGFGKGVHDFLHLNVTFADTKAGAILSLALALAALLAAHLPGGGFALAIDLVSLGVLAAASLACVAVVYPRVAHDPRGLIFWEGALARRSFDRYMSDLQNLDETGVEREFAIQNWQISHVLSQKYRWTRRAVLLFLAGALLALLGLVIASL